MKQEQQNLVSIKDYAEQKGITLQAVYKQIKLKQIKCVIADGKKFIKLDAKQKQQSNELVELLKQQLNEKDKQIENLTKANNNLTTLLAMKEQQILQLTYTPTFKEKITKLFKKDNQKS